MTKVVKVLTGNEHGGAAMSSELLIEGILKKHPSTLDFKVLMLCNGVFAKKIQAKYPKDTEIIESSEPPIIGMGNFLNRLLNFTRLMIWLIVSYMKLAIKLNGHKIDIIHTTNNYALIVCSLYRICHKTKLITHWRCIGGIKSRLFKLITSRADKILCISDSVKKSLPAKWQSKCNIVYDGVDVKALIDSGKNEVGKLRQYLNIAVDVPLFGTVGSYTTIKCHNLLIESCNLIHQRNPSLVFKCVLIGSTPNQECKKYLQDLKLKVNHYELDDFIEFVPDNVIAQPSAVIIDFDFFVGSTWLGGRGEGFGLMYIEAMAQSLPIIAIGVGAAQEIITAKVGILTKDDSTEEHAECINHMIDIDYRKHFDKKCICDYAYTYDISNTIKGVISNYL